ncbi:adenylyltransferase [Archaeoglobales archaeon]|nr:MAG: adenylyltransferase [Archaeoglobales archaeon]RLI78959.1 MAG: adenylyltransferase [Archaeoglobales archaeon]
MVFGGGGQKKLFNAKALVVGAGGLGSAAIQYLAAAGIGKLGIADGDVVEEHNLQRQTIHAGNVGMNKTESAKLFVEKLNPEVDVKTYPFNITPENVLEIVKNYDVVVSCPDNFKVRYLLNDACRIAKKPFIHAAIYGFEGEAFTVIDTPCYRCLFPEAPEISGLAVIGSTAGLFGCIQASEAIKVITGYGNLLEGKLLRIDLSTMEFFEIKFKTNPSCPVCSGELKEIHAENYEGSCKVVRL